MNFLVVIVTYNSMKWIEDCLKSLESSTIPLDVCVVDNKSTDETVDFIKNNFSVKYLYESQKNLGFGQANNVGFKYAIEHSYDYVILLNQDAYLDSNAIEQLLPYLDDKNIFSPIHLNGIGTEIDKNFKKSTLLNDFSLLLDDAILRKSKGVYKVPSVNAACWIISINLLKKIGGFNPIFFHYGEDTNYAHRLKYYGGSFLVLPTCFVRHDRNQYGNKAVYSSGILLRKLLLIATNINLTFKQRLSSFFVDMFFDIHKGGIGVILVYITSVYRLLLLSKSIKNSRKVEMHPLPWL